MNVQKVKESLESRNDVVQLWGQSREQRLQGSNAATLHTIDFPELTASPHRFSQLISLCFLVG